MKYHDIPKILKYCPALIYSYDTINNNVKYFCQQLNTHWGLLFFLSCCVALIRYLYKNSHSLLTD